MAYQSIFRSDLFKRQVGIVTGGGSGIGRCTAHELVALGANVAILGRTAEKLEEVKAEIEQEVSRAREALRLQVATLAVAGAEKILRREVDAKVHADLLKAVQAEL